MVHFLIIINCKILTKQIVKNLHFVMIFVTKCITFIAR